MTQAFKTAVITTFMNTDVGGYDTVNFKIKDPMTRNQKGRSDIHSVWIQYTNYSNSKLKNLI